VISGSSGMLHQIACGSRISQVRVLVNANAGAGFVLESPIYAPTQEQSCGE
jgi:hypothetical protein